MDSEEMQMTNNKGQQSNSTEVRTEGTRWWANLRGTKSYTASVRWLKVRSSWSLQAASQPLVNPCLEHWQCKCKVGHRIKGTHLLSEQQWPLAINRQKKTPNLPRKESEEADP